MVYKFLWVLRLAYKFTTKLPNLNDMCCLMSMNTSILVDSVGSPSAEVCRTAASFP
jgi:hypothetical protein